MYDELRVTFNKNWSGICHSGIGTLYYIYQNSFNSMEMIKYLSSIMSQLLLITNYTSFADLDRMESNKGLLQNYNAKIINEALDLNDFMFSGLKISEDIKIEMIKRK